MHFPPQFPYGTAGAAMLLSDKDVLRMCLSIRPTDLGELIDVGQFLSKIELA